VANLLILIGATFAERFLYAPSLGFSLLSGVLLMKLIKNDANVFSFKANPLFTGVFTLIMTLYSIQTLSRNRDWKDNETLFGADVVKSPRSARANYNYGTALLEKAKSPANSRMKNDLLKQALPYLLKAVEIYPGYIEALNNTGSAYYEMQDYPRALETFSKILVHMPEHNSVHYNLGITYEKMKMYSESAAHYLQYGKTTSNENILFRSAIMSGNAGNMQDAIATLNYLIQINPRYTDAYLNLGQAYGMTGDFPNSEKAFRKYLDLRPGDSDAMQGLATTLVKIGNKNEARELCRKIIEREPGNMAAQQMLKELSN
jgi:tetratricopeptide (TPR) repeat protein